jgi:hypothetical protein
MFQIGASLREARNRRGLSPADVQKSLRIRERYLTALEEERWEQLPGDAYVKGFLRTYAEFLGLNGQLYIEEYNSRFAHRDEAFVPDSLAPVTSRRSAVRLGALTVVVAGAVAGLAAWQLGGGTHSAAKAPSVGAEDAAAAVPREKPAPQPAASPVAKSRPVYAVFSAARGRSWVTVRVGGETGKVLYEGILEQGKTLRFGVKQALWVRMGRPSQLDVRLAGHIVGGLPGVPANLLLTPKGAETA